MHLDIDAAIRRTAPSLDNQYTVFGKVVEGFEAIQKIQRGDKIKTFTIQ